MRCVRAPGPVFVGCGRVDCGPAKVIVRSSAATSTATPLRFVLRLTGGAVSLVLEAACAVLVVAALVVMQTANAPLDIDLVTPRLVAEIKARTDVDLVLRSASLRWQGWQRGMGFGASDLQLRGPGGSTVLTLDQIGAAPVYRRLLERQEVVPQSVLAEGLRLVLVRGEDGAIGLGDLETRTPLPSDGGGPDMRAMLPRWLGPPRQDDPISAIESVDLRGGEAIVVDQPSRSELAVTIREMAARRDDRGVAGIIDLGLKQQEPDARFQVAFDRPFDSQTTDLDMALDGLELRTFSRAVPRLPGFRLHLPISGHATARLDPELTLDAFRFALDAPAGLFRSRTAPGWSMPLSDVLLSGELSDDRRRLTFTRMTLASRAARIEGAGSLALADGAGPKLELDLRADPVDVGQLAEVWPPDLHGGPRRWILRHVREGRAEGTRLALRLVDWPQSLGALPPEALQGGFRLRDLVLDYKPPMPPVVASSGQARFTGDGIAFELDGEAQSAGLTARSANVQLSALAPPRGDELLRIELEASGPAAQAMRLLRSPPLNLLRGGPMAPDNVGGHGSANVVIEMPLGRMDPESIDVRYEVETQDVALGRVTEGVSLAAGRFAITGDRRHLALQGNARLNDVPAAIEGAIDLPRGQPPQERYRVRAGLDEAERAKLRWPGVPEMTGPVAVDASLIRMAGTRAFQLAANADLTRARVRLDPIGLEKAAGRVAALDVNATLIEGQAPRETRFRLQGTRMTGSGTADLAIRPLRLTRLQIDNATFDENSASVIVSLPEPRTADLVVRADRLALDPFVDRITRPGAAAQGQPLQRLTIDLAAERIGLSNRPPITDFAGRFAQAEGVWQELYFNASLPGGQALMFRRLVGGDRPLLRLDAHDTGALYRAITGSPMILGGRSRLVAAYDERTLRPSGPGTFVLRDFTLQNAPALAQMLSLGSLTGIVNTLAGEGIEFDRFNLGFTVNPQSIEITDGRLRGSQIGVYGTGTVVLGNPPRVDLSGTLIPVRGLNQVLGNIPVLGTLLTGEDREGVFGMTYTVNGPIDRPEMMVNPLSALAPGLLRDLFQGLGDGSLEAPPPYEYDREGE